MSESNIIHTELTVGFAKGTPSPPISIVGREGYAPDGVPLMALGPVTTITCDVGSIASGEGGSTSHIVPAGMCSFSGTTSSLPAIPVGSPTFKVLFAFSETGQSLGAGVSVHYDPKTYSVIANRPFTGVVSYSAYTASGRPFLYKPKITSLGIGSTGGQLVTYGIVAAFAPPSSLTTFQVPPTTGPEQVDIEIYRRVSDGLTTDEGELEFPPKYPADGKYPDTTYEADLSKCLKIERVHEIGIMGPTGHIGVRTFYVPICKPYVGIHNYKPVIRCVKSPLPPGMSPSDMAKANDAIAKLGYGCT